MSSDFTNADAKAGACAYVLHALLQRLEVGRPGLVLDLLDGVKSDKTSIESQGAMSESVSRVFDETVALLERVHAQIGMQDTGKL